MGGQPQIVAPDMRQGWGGSWSSDGFIYYSAEIPGDLYRIHRVADGGEPELLEANDDVADLTHGWVDALPGGGHLLYSTRPNDGRAAQGPITLLSLENRETRTLVENAYHARYVPSGHIVFIRADSIWAVPFDLEQLETAGPEVPVVNGVHSQGTRGEAAYAVSEAALASS